MTAGEAAPRWRFTLRYWLGFLGVLLLWFGMSRWAIPRVIESAYHGRSLSVLNGLITGQATLEVDVYFAAWRSLARSITVGLVAVAAVIYAGVLFRRPITTAITRMRAWVTKVPVRWGQALAIAVWLGAVMGGLEALVVHLRWAILGFPGREYSRHVLWTAPLTTAVVFALVTMTLVLLFGRRGKVGQGLVVLAVTFLGSYVLLRVSKLGFQQYAALLLASGIAVQLTRVSNERAAQFIRVVRRSSRYVASAIVIAATLLIARDRIGWWNALRHLPAPAAGSPNIVLLVLDTVRASSLSLYGYGRSTSPRLDGLAERGMTFDMAIAPSSWTLPSHATLFTGHWHHEVSADWMVPLDDTFPTLAEALAAQGYETAGFVANTFYASRETGLGRGFHRYDDRPLTLGSVLNDSWLTRMLVLSVKTHLGNHQGLVTRTAESINARVFDWLSARKSRPFFLFVNYFDAHDPYRPPPPYSSRFGSSTGRYYTAWNAKYEEHERRELIDAYDNAIAYVDAQVGALIDSLAAWSMLDSTVVLVTSDHGEQFGERHPRLYNHGNSLYLPLLRVPLVILYPPDIPPASRTDAPVTLRDVPATLLQLAQPEAHSPFPGRSLTRYWKRTTSDHPPVERPVLAELEVNQGWSKARPWARDFEPVHRGPMKSLLSGHWHYIRNGDGGEDLFDVAADPWERQDLSSREPWTRALPGFRACLAHMLTHDDQSNGSTSPDDDPCAELEGALPATRSGDEP